jgi:hypothetical protein
LTKYKVTSQQLTERKELEDEMEEMKKTAVKRFEPFEPQLYFYGCDHHRRTRKKQKRVAKRTRMRLRNQHQMVCPPSKKLTAKSLDLATGSCRSSI